MRDRESATPLLFRRSPKIEQMRDPLASEWNLDLVERLSVHELNELIDFSPMNVIFQNYLEVVGLPVAIIDFDARVLASSKWQRVCTEFHRKNEQTLVRCLESDVILSRQMLSGKPYAIYRCYNGLTDCASPIVIAGKHLANLFIGQFFLEPPDLNYFRRQQEEFGFDKDDYFKAISEVPIVAEEKIPAILNLLSGLAHQIALQSLAEKKTRAAYESVEKQVQERTRELKNSHELLQKLSSQIPGVIYQLYLSADGELRMPYVSEGVNELFEVTSDNVQDNVEALFARIHPEDVHRVRQRLLDSAKAQTVWGDQYRVVLPRQGLRWREGTACPEKLPDGGVLWHGFIQDVTQRKQAEAALAETRLKLEELSLTDGLTGIANRRHFDAVLAMEHARHVRTGGSLSLLLLDIDDFKLFNDNYGHVVGDECLRQVALVLARHTARPSDLAARYGGEEFACILPETDARTAVAVAEGIRRDILAQAIAHKGSRAANCVTVSVGVVTVKCSPGMRVEDIIVLADKSLYCAKSNGRNRVERAEVVFRAEDAPRSIERRFVKLVWDESFCCRNALIDAQHLSLFQLSNDLIDSESADGSPEEVSRVVARLLDEVVRHFHDEEQILKAVGFPELEKHADEHARLVEKGVLLLQQHQCGALCFGEVFQFLVYEVIQNHMLGLDREYFPYIRE